MNHLKKTLALAAACFCFAGAAAAEPATTAATIAPTGPAMPLVRMAYIELKPEMRETFIAIVTEGMREALKKEPGVLALYCVAAKDNPNKLTFFEVYANEKIGAQDREALEKIASAFENTLTLLTCEDERPEGGYASRRIVAAKLTEE